MGVDETTQGEIRGERERFERERESTQDETGDAGSERVNA